MSKTFFAVDDVLKRLVSYTPIREGLLIGLFTVPGVSIQAAQNMEYSDRPFNQIEMCSYPVSSLSAGQAYSQESNGLEFFMGNTFNLTGQLQAAFDELCKNKPAALELKPAFCMISEGIGDIMAEKVSVSCDVESKIMNVAYRMPGDMLLSVSKPLNTMEDSFVMFNLFHLRELLISDTAEISFLSTYIHNAAARIAQVWL